MATETQPQVACDVKDLALADQGKRRMEWAFQSMPVLQTIRKQFIKTQPLAGIRISACLHVTTETANLMVDFYRHLQKGRSAPEALREAQLAMIRAGKAPLYWAPFIMIGE